MRSPDSRLHVAKLRISAHVKEQRGQKPMLGRQRRSTGEVVRETLATEKANLNDGFANCRREAA